MSETLTKSSHALTVMVWKEARQLRNPLLTGLIAGLVVFSWPFVVGVGHSFMPASVAQLFSFLGITTFATFGLMFGVELFASENDRGTIGLLKSLPWPSWRYALAKLGIGAAILIAAFLLMYGLFWGQYQLLAHWEVVTPFYEVLRWDVGLVVCVWVYLITSLVAVWSRHMLATGLIAVVVSGLLLGWLPALIREWANSKNWGYQTSFSEIALNNPLLYPLTDGLWFAATIREGSSVESLLWGSWVWNVAGWSVCVWLVTLRAEQWIRPRIGGGQKSFFKTGLLAAERTAQTSNSSWRSFYWLAIRQSYGIGCWLLSLALVLPFCISSAGKNLGIFGPFIFNVYVLSVLIALATGTMFSNEQSQTHLGFYQQHTASGRKLWISRLTVWLGLTWLAIGGTLLLNLFLILPNFPEFDVNAMMLVKKDDSVLGAQWLFRRLGEFFWLGIVLLAVGQFCSLLFRRAITAVCVSAMSGMLVCFWAISIAQRGESLIWSLLPWGLCVLYAGWYAASQWLSGVWSLRRRVIMVSGLLAAFLLQFGLFAAKRRYEFSLITPSYICQQSNFLSADFLKAFSLRELKVLEPTANAKVGQRLQLGKGIWDITPDYWRLHKNSVIAYLDQNRDTLELAKDTLLDRSPLEARLRSRPRPIDWFTSGTPEACSKLILNLINAFDWDAQKLLEQGRLTECRDCLTCQFKLVYLLPGSVSSYAMERLVGRTIQWAEHPDQTAEAVKNLSSDLEFEHYLNRSLNRPSLWYKYSSLVIGRENSLRSESGSALLNFLDFEGERRYRLQIQRISRRVWNDQYPSTYDPATFVPVRDRYFSYFSFWPLVSIGPAEHFWREADVNREMGNYFFDLEDKFFSELTSQLVDYALGRLSLQAKYLEAGVFPENYSRSEYYRPQGFPESLAFSVSQPTINGYELIGKRNSPNGQLTLPVSLPTGWGQVWLQVEKSDGQTETLPAYTPCLFFPFPTTFKNYRLQQSWYGLIDFRLKPNRPSERLAEPRPSPVGE